MEKPWLSGGKLHTYRNDHCDECAEAFGPSGDVGQVVDCSTCPEAWHGECMPGAARAAMRGTSLPNEWVCQTCTVETTCLTSDSMIVRLLRVKPYLERFGTLPPFDDRQGPGSALPTFKPVPERWSNAVNNFGVARTMSQPAVAEALRATMGTFDKQRAAIQKLLLLHPRGRRQG